MFGSSLAGGACCRISCNRARIALVASVAFVALCGLAHAQPSSTVAAKPAAAPVRAASAPAAQPAPTASQAGAVPLARPSDTIGEAADRQRTMRMLQSQTKPLAAAAVAGSDAKVPAIIVERAPEKAGAGAPQGAARAAEPPMVLTEVMRGPTKLLAGIEVHGVNRFVSVGENIGNGWRVLGIDKYRVILVAEAPAARAGDKSPNKAADKPSKARGRDAKPEEPAAPRTLVLPLGMRMVAAPAHAVAPGADSRN